ncbi:helix-turn-helix domain-containing protein [Streptomyces cavernae]|uniref:helix-turn-helix domain-containing protein n=1 Tax=Streptomyces cavernae TaxID=2259034 RepID=UPI001EE3F5A8|nr:helix-turn-helix domain-containing protein [Streptomyces cavernae]
MRDQRRLAGLSAAELAARIGRTTWCVYGIETGRMQPSLAVAAAAADALALPLESLLLDDLNEAA